MRSPGPMTSDEFDEALAYALDGVIVTDHGATDEIQDALTAIAEAAPNPPASLIEAARDAFARRE